MSPPDSKAFNVNKVIALVSVAGALLLALVYLEFVAEREQLPEATDETRVSLEDLPETVPLPPIAAGIEETKSVSLMRATLHPTFAVDLETGLHKDTPRDRLDLWWQAMTASDRCLCPMIESSALLARLPPEKFDTVDGTTLAAKFSRVSLWR